MVKITKEEYDKIHPHYKGLGEDGKYRILKNIDGETISVVVEIIN